MAYNIKPLRQQNIFDNFGLGNLMDDPGYDYGNEQSQSRGPTFYGSDRPPDAESRYGNNTGQYSTGPSDTENEGLEYQNPISDVSRVSTQSRSALRSSNTDADAEDAKRIMEIINQTYTPTNTARDRFGNLLDNPPEREEPSFARRMVGFGVGLGNKGMGVAPSVGEQEKVLYAPYMRDMAEWTAKAAPFQQAAQLENSANSIERQLASGVATNAVAAQRNRQQSEAAQARTEETQRHNTETEAVARDKAAVYRMVQTGGIEKIISDGNNIVIFYKDGRNEVTSIPGSAVSKTELAELNNAAALARVKEAGNQDRLTNAAPGGSASTAKSQTASEKIKERQDVLNSIWDNNPEYREFLQRSNGITSIAPRPEYGWFSTDATDEAKMARYDAFRKSLDPNYQPPTGAKQPEQAPNVSPQATQGLGPQNIPAPRMTTPYGAAPPTTPGQAQLPPNMSGQSPAGPTLFPKGTFGEYQDQRDKQAQQAGLAQADQAKVASGAKIIIYDKRTGEASSITNSPEALQWASGVGAWILPNDPGYAQAAARANIRK